MNFIIKFFLFAFVFLSITACNRTFTKFNLFISTKRKIPIINKLPSVKLSKDIKTQLISLSVVTRDNKGEGGFKWIPTAEVMTNPFVDNSKLLFKHLEKVKVNNAFPLIYDGSNLNDSIYKSIFTHAFKRSYHHHWMQTMNFENVERDGLYLIVTIVEFWTNGFGGGGYGGTSGGGGGVSYNTLYEFFEVKKGNAVAYSGYSIGRNDVLKKAKKVGAIRYKDFLWVLSKLYK